MKPNPRSWELLDNSNRFQQLINVMQSDSVLWNCPEVIIRLGIDTYTSWRIAYNIFQSTKQCIAYEQFIEFNGLDNETGNFSSTHYDLIVDVSAALLAYPNQDYLFDMQPDHVVTLGALGNNAAALLAPYLYGLKYLNSHCESVLPVV